MVPPTTTIAKRKQVAPLQRHHGFSAADLTIPNKCKETDKKEASTKGAAVKTRRAKVSTGTRAETHQTRNHDGIECVCVPNVSPKL